MKKFFYQLKIRTKLITITSLIILTSLSVMIFLATIFFRSDNKIRVQENNLKLANSISLTMQTEFSSLVEKINLIGTTIIQQFSSQAQKNLFSDLFFTNDRNLIYVGIGEGGRAPDFRKYIYNKGFFRDNRFFITDIEKINWEYREIFSNAFNNYAVVHNVSRSFKMPVIALSLPFQRRADGSVLSIIVGYVKLDRFLQAFKTSESDIIETFMVDNTGNIIAHPDSKIVLSHGNYINLPIVQMMLKSKSSNQQTRYLSTDGKYYLGSFQKIGFSGLGIIATVAEDKAFEAVSAIQRRNLYIMFIVLILAVNIVYFFGKTLTTPIIRLLGATHEIEKGNFRVDIVPTSGDEIGELTTSFVSMGRGLEEREKMKDAFGKFVNKEIAEQVLKGEIKLGGERKTATVFFSDIRSFTEISEKLEPEEVVEFLNQYMTRMVNCVNETGGVVDKYIGDAIMAVWGAPVSRGNDTENAIDGALMMRRSLMEFNRGRGTDKKPVIRIGCGINTGPVLAGQIGSEERMEYTVIGDTVNLASRIEALNKPFGTDILISEDTYRIVKNIYRVEEMQKIKVKGKAMPQQIFAVLGRLDDAAAPESLDRLREMLGIDMKGKPEVADEKEVKYEILE